jgi:HK97 family phage portal protein
MMMNRLNRLLPERLRMPVSGPEPEPGEQKSAIQPIVALHNLLRAEWTLSAPGALASEGFARNPVVYRCVRMISEAAASLQWLLYDGEDELDTHPLLQLLGQPNTRQDGHSFLETLYGHLLISGNAYAHLICVDENPRELHSLRPDCVTAVPGADGWPEAYDYRTAKYRMRFETGGPMPLLLHLQLFNPLDEINGMPPLQAARMALEIHNAACCWNKALLDNSARPSGALVYTASEGGNLTQAQFDRLKQELEEGYTGASMAGRPMVLEGGLDWKAMGYSPRDMDFMEARNGAARDIALAFGVPPMLLGIPGDNTYANYSEANRAFWRQTVLPLASRSAGMLGNWLGAFYEGKLRLDFDRDAIEALAGDRDLLWQRLGAAQFLTMNEKRAAAGYGPIAPDEIENRGE